MPILKESEQVVAGYSVLHIIGHGGQAKVYLAERDHDGLRVALKVLDRTLRQDATFLERFVREYRLIASIQNEHVALIYDQGFTGDYPYLAMEFLPSGTLASSRGWARVRRCASRRRSPTPSTPFTRTASCIATSSRRTSCSVPTARRSSSTSACRSIWAGTARLPRPDSFWPRRAT
jgi:serine/threonine protein kinase